MPAIAIIRNVGGPRILDACLASALENKTACGHDVLQTPNIACACVCFCMPIELASAWLPAAALYCVDENTSSASGFGCFPLC